MNETYIKYAAIGLLIVVFLYLLSRNSGGGSSSGAVDVSVEYQPSEEALANIEARGEAFGALVGLGGTAISEYSAMNQAADANRTARQISRDETNLGAYALDVESRLGMYGLDTSRQVEQMRLQAAREMAEFQARQVNQIAYDYRKNDVDRQSVVLNALTSIWGVSPTYRPSRENPATGILGAIGGIVNGVSRFFAPTPGGLS